MDIFTILSSFRNNFPTIREGIPSITQRLDPDEYQHSNTYDPLVYNWSDNSSSITPEYNQYSLFSNEELLYLKNILIETLKTKINLYKDQPDNDELLAEIIKISNIISKINIT